jgi:hypothetical protein
MSEPQQSRVRNNKKRRRHDGTVADTVGDKGHTSSVEDPEGTDRKYPNARY